MINKNPLEAAKKLTKFKTKEGFAFEALHQYQNVNSEVLFYVCRLKHPTTGDKYFSPMHWGGQNFILGLPKDINLKPLYKLPRLINSSGIVFIVEGELKADSLEQLGAVVVTSQGGANSANKTDWTPLQGREVVIWGDNDQAGAQYATTVAKILTALACSVQIINTDSLGLIAGGDFIDWHKQNPQATFDDVLSLPKFVLPVIAENNLEITDNEEQDNEAINRLAKLPVIEYEKQRTAEAKAMGIRASILDKLVKEARPKNEDGSGQKIDIHQPTAWHEKVNGLELAGEIEGILTKFIYLPKYTSTAITLWIIFTYTIDLAYFAPILAILSPEKRCGKTTLLTFLTKLCNRVLSASNISPPAVYRVIEATKPTLLIDEADSFLKANEELRGVVNSGHSRDTAFVVRCEGDNNEPKQFSTWSAKAIAGIGNLPDTITDRSIIIKMERKTANEKIESLRNAKVSFYQIQQKLIRWTNDNAEAIRDSQINQPRELNDRAADNWSCLFNIAQVVGGEWLAKAYNAATKLSEIDDGETIKTNLLADIKAIFDNLSSEHISTNELIEKLCEDNEKDWASFYYGKKIIPKQLARQLRSFGIKSQNLKMGSGVVNKGYRKIDFENAFNRYIKPSSTDGVNFPATPLPSSERLMNKQSIGSGYENTINTPNIYPLPKNSMVATHTAKGSGVAGKLGGNSLEWVKGEI